MVEGSMLEEHPPNSIARGKWGRHAQRWARKTAAAGLEC
jgi:hypothetical protein